MVRVMRLGFAIGLLASACSLAEEIEGEPCEVDDDCWHSQHCARTPEEEQLGLAGMCLPDDTDCAFGAQLGCACSPDDFEANCTSGSQFLHDETYPEMICEPDLLACVVPTEESES